MSSVDDSDVVDKTQPILLNATPDEYHKSTAQKALLDEIDPTCMDAVSITSKSDMDDKSEHPDASGGKFHTKEKASNNTKRGKKNAGSYNKEDKSHKSPAATNTDSKDTSSATKKESTPSPVDTDKAQNRKAKEAGCGNTDAEKSSTTKKRKSITPSRGSDESCNDRDAEQRGW